MTVREINFPEQMTIHHVAQKQQQKRTNLVKFGRREIIPWIKFKNEHVIDPLLRPNQNITSEYKQEKDRNG